MPALDTVKYLKDIPNPYCPGCSHGLITRLIVQAVEELEIANRAICITSIGCTVRMYHIVEFDMVQAAHGRAPAVATGIRRVRPEAIIFSYQGDGDLASIGMAELIHAAARGENMTIFFINNANYGMTGGQLAPTTLIGQKTTTTPMGRDSKKQGYPIKVVELLSSIEGVAYLARGAVYNPALIRKSKQYIKKAFTAQAAKRGFSLVELLSACPTNWGLTAVESNRWIDEHLTKQYPLGEVITK